jgi:hypothetical protein
VVVAPLLFTLLTATPDAAPTTQPMAPIDEARLSRQPTLDFELLPPVEPPNAKRVLVLEHEAHIRRSMIQWHVGLGIATTLLLAATVIAGQLDYTDRFSGGTSTGQYEAWHTSFEAVATTTFAVDGLLALFAPVPYAKADHSVSSLTIHKLAMLTATVGFASEVPLGILTVAREGYTNQPTLALVHLIVGYVTAAAVTAGVSALAF